MSSASSTPIRRSFVITRISSGGAPVGKRFRNIDNQCPLVKSRNIAELQHLAMTRRVGESGLSRCSSRYCCPIMHCTRSFRYRIKLFHCRNRARAAQKPVARTDVRLLGNSCSSRTRSESAGRLPRISPYRIGTSRRDVCAVSGSRHLPILGSHSLEDLLSVVKNVGNGSNASGQLRTHIHLLPVRLRKRTCVHGITACRVV